MMSSLKLIGPALVVALVSMLGPHLAVAEAHQEVGLWACSPYPESDVTDSPLLQGDPRSYSTISSARAESITTADWACSYYDPDGDWEPMAPYYSKAEAVAECRTQCISRWETAPAYTGCSDAPEMTIFCPDPGPGTHCTTINAWPYNYHNLQVDPRTGMPVGQ